MSTLDSEGPGRPPGYPDGLVGLLGALAPGNPRRADVRTRVIQGHLALAASLAHRYGGRGEPLADLVQVATVGLIKAVDRFDATRGVSFVAFARPTILGEIRRHFRDSTWGMRVPRRLQELRSQSRAAVEELTHRLHRPPTAAELAGHLGVTPALLAMVEQSATAYRPMSIDQPVREHPGVAVLDAVGEPDTGIDQVDNRESVRAALALLPEPERRVVALRFYAGLSQVQIAAELGVSQMQVSRRLARSLALLRRAMTAGDTVGGPPVAG